MQNTIHDTAHTKHNYLTAVTFASNSIGISVRRAPPHFWFWKSSRLASIEMAMVKV